MKTLFDLLDELSANVKCRIRGNNRAIRQRIKRPDVSFTNLIEIKHS